MVVEGRGHPKILILWKPVILVKNIEAFGEHFLASRQSKQYQEKREAQICNVNH